MNIIFKEKLERFQLWFMFGNEWPKHMEKPLEWTAAYSFVCRAKYLWFQWHFYNVRVNDFSSNVKISKVRDSYTWTMESDYECRYVSQIKSRNEIVCRIKGLLFLKILKIPLKLTLA